MKITKLSAIFLPITLSFCLVYAVTYQHGHNTAKLIFVGLRIEHVTLSAVVDIKPETLNLRGRGLWVTSHIELPRSYSVSDIDISTIRLNATIQAELRPTAMGDHDGDAVQDLMVKFDRAFVISYIYSQGISYGNVTLTITGKLNDKTPFQGSDTITVILPGRFNQS